MYLSPKTWSAALFLALFVLSSCGQGRTKDVAANPEATKEAPAEGKNLGAKKAAPTVEEAPKVAEDKPKELPSSMKKDSYELSLNAPKDLKADQEALANLSLHGVKGWHVNQEYPIKIEISGDEGVTLAKAKLGKADAAEFNDDVARFDIPMTATGGKHAINAKVAFAMCNPKNCVMEREELALNIDVPTQVE